MSSKQFAKMADIRQAKFSLSGHGRDSARYKTGAVERVVRAAGNTPTAKVYGVEIELPVRSDIRTEDMTALDDMPIDRKSDGSLGYADIEFVFPPMSPNQWRMSKLFDQFVEAYSQIQTRRTANNYGTHIHTNVNAWHPASVALVYPIVRSNSELFAWVAGRYGYDNLSYSSLAACRSGLQGRSIAGYSRHGTVEFRIFDATTDRDRLLSWMKWIDAVEDYVRQPEIIESYHRNCGITDDKFTTTAKYRQHVNNYSVDSTAEHNRQVALLNGRMDNLFTADIANDTRFRDWLRSAYVRSKYPLVYNAFAFFSRNRCNGAFTGNFSYAHNLNLFMGVTDNADASSSSRSAIPA
jgi:hypothetical protein